MCLRRRRRRFVVVVVVVVVVFFPQRVIRLLCFRAFVALARSIDRWIAGVWSFPRRNFSVINIFVETRICGNLTEREEDQFTARFLVAIFGFFWFSWLAVLERQFSLLHLLSASRHQQVLGMTIGWRVLFFLFSTIIGAGKFFIADWYLMENSDLC